MGPKAFRVAAGILVMGLLGACEEAATVSVASEAPSPAVQGCLRDVANTTNNGEVVVLESNYSEAGTQVIVGVGPDEARWNCIGYTDGTTAGIQSLTDEGYL